MMENSFIRIYTGADAPKRVDIIIKNYPDFMGMVDSFTEGLRYLIETEKDNLNHSDTAELGIRVKSSGVPGNPTANKAINSVMTKEALINCDFSGDVFDGIDSPDEYIKDAFMLRDMRKDYELFDSQISILGKEKDVFRKYLKKEISIIDIAEEKGITYESAAMRIHRMKKKVIKQVACFMERNVGGIF